MSRSEPQDRPVGGGVFLGRESELSQLTELLESGGGLITVTGPPGMGKTCLARCFAKKVVDEGHVASDAVVFCDLSQAWSVADIVTNLSAALGAHLSGADGETSTVELLGQAIQGRGRALIILDNFEQLVELAPQTVSVWLRLAPSAGFLVTSRDRLRLRGETCLALPPLPQAAAADLFAAAATAVNPAFSLDAEALPAVQELVQRLDGIPLAIELAAARSGVMSAGRMLDRIDRRFQLLGHGPSDGVARQATLRAAIDWSWNLLEDAERAVMAQCSVFRGGFSLDAAEAVVELPGDVDLLDLLEKLHRKSLIYSRRLDRAGGEMGFDIYESIRDYASEHLGEDETCVRGRHADFFIRKGELQIDEFGSPEGTDLGWLERNRDNLLAAAHGHQATDPTCCARAILCLAHAQIRRGPYDSLLDLLSTVPRGAGMPREVAARLSFAQGVAESILGRTERAAGLIETARTLASDNGLGRLEAKSTLHLGLNQLRIGQLDAARVHLTAALELSEAGGLDRIHARTLASMGMTHEATAGFDEAERCYQAAGTIARRVGDTWEEARSRSKMGTLCSFMEGRQEEARGHLEWALERSLGVGDQFIAATTSYNLGRLELNLGHLSDAEEHLCHALVEYRDMANRVSEGFVRMALGLLHLDGAATVGARAVRVFAGGVLRAVSHPLAQAFCEVTLAMVDLIEGQPAAAMRRSSSALQTVVARKHAVLEGVSASMCGIVAFAQGDAEACQEHRDRARTCLQESGWGEGVAMLQVVEVCAGGSEEMPDLAGVRYARARVGWRIVEQLQNAGAGSPVQDGTEVAPRRVGTEDSLVIHSTGRWFQMPGTEAIDLSRKRTLKPMLLLLARQRLDHPGEALDVDQIFNGVWPGERALERARKNRVYVSIATLRKMGLEEVLTTRGDGYLLRPDLSVVIDG